MTIDEVDRAIYELFVPDEHKEELHQVIFDNFSNDDYNEFLGIDEFDELDYSPLLDTYYKGGADV